MKYSRKQYITKEVTHREYYEQMVTNQTLRLVSDHIGIARLMKSTDEHLNDIPLKEWDRLAKVASFTLADGEIRSLSTVVCVLKESARILMSRCP